MNLEGNSFCWICFNADLKLLPLEGVWKNHCILNILGHELDPGENKSIYVCVNCAASVRRCARFHIQVKQSYRLLTECNGKITKNFDQPSRLRTWDQFNIIINPDGTWEDNISLTNQLEIKPELPEIVYTSIQSGNSDTEAEQPLIKLKKIKRKRQKKNNIDIYKVIELSNEDIRQERELLACEEEFTNATLKCDRCIVTFANQGDLDDHMNKKHDESLPYKCDVCGRCFSSEVTHTYHRNKHRYRHKCRQCKHLFRTQHAVTKHHYMEHSGIHQNNVDNIPSKEKESIKVDSESDVYKCELCPKQFKFRSSLRKHLDSHLVASGTKRKPICEPCGLSFTNTANLQKHMKTSSKHQLKLKLRKLDSQVDKVKIDEIKNSLESRKMYRCESCDKSFQWRGNLSRHMKSHIAKANGELCCVPCGRAFSSVATLQQHLTLSRKHVTEDTYKYMCSDCGSKFVSKTKLTDHINWEHLKKYQHVCTECKKVFKTHTSLYLHTQFVHKKSKEYLCDHCGKGFPIKSKLLEHISACHGSASLRCHCGAAFAWSSCLARHKATLHHKS